MIAFNKSIKGSSHIKRGIVCQDYSAAYDMSRDGKKLFLAALSDGHGDETCFRSQIGSKNAVFYAVSSMASFIEATRGIEGDSFQIIMDNEDQMVRRLTDKIISGWAEWVEQDFRCNPITDEEKKKAGKYLELYEKGEEIEHPYGATLLTALLTEDYLLMLHQGDGRCIVFWDDGSCEEPVPWDEKCIFTTTTSLCDKSAADRIRHCFIPLNGRMPMAVFLLCDGVEDSYPDMEGTYCFLRELMKDDLAEGSREEVEKRLEEVLADLSENGSGDDISIAGIIDQEMIKDHAEDFAGEIDRYHKQYRLKELRSKIPSMERKDKVLKDRLASEMTEEQQEVYTEEYEKYHTKYMKLKEELSELEKEGGESDESFRK